MIRARFKKKFRPGEKVLVWAASKPNKLAVQWVGPGTVESQLSETNYIIQMPGRAEKLQIYHVNLLKPYHQRVENINLLMSEGMGQELTDSDLDISYPTANPNIFDFGEIIKDSELSDRCSPDQIVQVERLLKSHLHI
jgi:hypothetical protein